MKEKFGEMCIGFVFSCMWLFFLAIGIAVGSLDEVCEFRKEIF